MTNGNEPIGIGYTANGGMLQNGDWQFIQGTKAMIGLTKREQFAAMAMQGLCASGFFTDEHMQQQSNSVGATITHTLVVAALDIADTLIDGLNTAGLNPQSHTDGK